MSLDPVTNIAQIAAALATVITLAYLAIQIRSNNNLQKAESRRSVLSHSAQLATAIGQSSDSSDVFYRGLTAYWPFKRVWCPCPYLRNWAEEYRPRKINS